MNGHNFSESFAFLSPFSTIRNGHLSKKDVHKIKLSLGIKIGSLSFLVSFAILAINIVLFFIWGHDCNYDFSSLYSIYSLIGLGFSLTGCFSCLICMFISFSLPDEEKKAKLSSGAIISLLIGVGTFMILCLHADALQGYLTTESVSPAITLIAILLILQPVFWSQAIIVDLIIATGLIVISIHGAIEHNVQSIHYYIITAIVFLLLSYLVVSILFYAESQNYSQRLINDSLFNTAMYDELTKCKNRHALRECLKENQKRWETKNINLLMVFFDIDNFKEYNDQFSHSGGDYCLISVAEAIRKEFRSPNLDFFRYGGEEFLLFLEINNPDDARMIALQVKNTIKNLKIVAPEGAPKDMVTVSVGASLIVCPIEFNFESSIKEVDKYLYIAKNSGKDVVCLDGNIIK